MALHSISEAHRLTGKARSTIRRDLRSGRLSATQDPDGASKIDTAELVRVYGPLQGLQEHDSTRLQLAPGGEVEQTPPRTAPRAVPARDPGELDGLRQRLADAEARAARAEGERDALRDAVDHAREDAAAWRQRADRADLLLADLRRPQKRRWWPWG